MISKREDVDSNENSKQNTANNSQENLRENIETQAPQIPINKWPNDRVLDWFSKKFPMFYDAHKECLVQNQITGESLLQFNTNCLDQLKIFDTHLREQILEEIALLKIKNEYEFIRRFKSQSTS